MCEEDEQKIEAIQFEELIQGLIENKYGSCNNFISPITILGLRDNLTERDTLGYLKTAGIGNNKDQHQDKLIRSDKLIGSKKIVLIYLKKSI